MSDRLMRNSRAGLGDIPSQGEVDARPASARSRRAKARGRVCGLKSRPFPQRVIVASRTLTSNDFTPKCGGRHDIVAVCRIPYGLGRPTMSRAGWSPVRGGNGGHVAMAETLISIRLLEVISTLCAGNAQSGGEPPFPAFIYLTKAR
jgi:hypothetical protein